MCVCVCVCINININLQYLIQKIAIQGGSRMFIFENTSSMEGGKVLRIQTILIQIRVDVESLLTVFAKSETRF